MPRLRPLMLLPPLVFAALAVLFWYGNFRDGREELPSAREGQPAPPVVLTQLGDKPVFDDATATFVEWTDLDASLTEFVVAAHMDAVGVDHILTYDRHYDAFDVTTLPYRS